MKTMLALIQKGKYRRVLEFDRIEVVQDYPNMLAIYLGDVERDLINPQTDTLTILPEEGAL